MVDLLHNAFSIFLEYSNTYIHKTEEPMRWLPIVALGWSLIESKNLRLFGKKEVVQRYHQKTKQELLELLLVSRRRRVFSVCLLSFVSWICLFMFLVTQREHL